MLLYDFFQCAGCFVSFCLLLVLGVQIWVFGLGLWCILRCFGLFCFVLKVDLCWFCLIVLGTSVEL